MFRNVALGVCLSGVASGCVFSPPRPQPIDPIPPINDINWMTTPSNLGLRGQNGQRFSYRCPPNGRDRIIWGTDVYTDDSPICVAAVHFGLITLWEGGVVTIEISPGRSQYFGSTRYGITSYDYGSWGGSYFFPTRSMR